MMRYFNKPYDLLQIPKFKFFYTIGVAIFCFMFLYTFEPFGLYNVSGLFKLKIISSYVISGFIITAIHLFWLQNIIIKRFTLGNTILWISWITLLTSISSSVINDLAFNKGHFSVLSIVIFIGIVFLIQIIPISIIILGHYIYLLKKRIKVTSQINSTISHKSFIGNSSEEITILASNQRDNITLNLSDLLYITSADNYIDVYYLESKVLKHNLLRNTLNNIEKQITKNYQSIKRCHKSFIVNIDLVKSVSGNASGYKIELKRVELLIPISRKYKDDIFKYLNS
ncbi:MAG: hypothetical protein DRI54_06055 [Bacteroidetes bacterium]|nr:MAG: hypothetical protein DRI54_06055 [Bacteroidota bacterium]